MIPLLAKYSATLLMTLFHCDAYTNHFTTSLMHQIGQRMNGLTVRITMQQQGVSKVLKVKLNDALTYAQREDQNGTVQ